MKIETLFKEWSEDSKIDGTNLASDLSRIPYLHCKYLEIYTKEKLRLRKIKSELSVLERDKYQYYTGSIDTDLLKEYGWEPFNLNILKSQVQTFLDSDKDLIDMKLRVGLNEEIVEALESIVKQISTRNFILRSMIDLRKFEAGI